MSEILKSNLEHLEKYNPALVNKILTLKGLKNSIQVIQSDSGDPNLTYNNQPVHDNVDPIYEAAEICQKNTAVPGADKVHVIYGMGLGYLLKRFADKTQERLILIEPNIEILRAVLEAVDFTPELSRKNLRVASDDVELKKCVSSLSVNYSDTLTLSYTDFYLDNYTSHIRGIEETIKKFNKPQKIIDKPAKINIGAGAWGQPGWLILDCYQEADIQIDLRKCEPFPVADNMLEKVFSSHCIEHIEDPHLEFLLKELYRTMQPGGILRLICPDAEMALEAYRNNDHAWFNGLGTRRDDPIGARLLNSFVSYEAMSGGPQLPEDVIREKVETLELDEFINWALSLCDRSRHYIAHINGIYYAKLRKMLENTGFVDIEKSSYQQSRDEELRGANFDKHPVVSLYVECYKPDINKK